MLEPVVEAIVKRQDWKAKLLFAALSVSLLSPSRPWHHGQQAVVVIMSEQEGGNETKQDMGYMDVYAGFLVRYRSKKN